MGTEFVGGRMNEKEEPVPPTAAGAAAPGPSAGKAKGVDRWLQQQLGSLYNDVVNEPLPPEFLEILARIRQDKPQR